MGSSTRAYLLVNAATLLWAGNVVLGRALREAVGPWTLAGVRAAVASVPFALLLLRSGGSTARPRDWLLVLGMAGSGVVGFQVLQYAGLRFTTALNAGVVNATGPLLTLALARALGGERMRPGQVVGSLVSLVGVGVVLSGGSWDSLRELRFNPGDLLVLGAVFLWAVYSLLGRELLARHSTVWVTACSTIGAVPLLAAPAALEWVATPPHVQASLVLAVVYIGVGPSFLAFLAWNQGIRRLGATGAMAFYNTLPVYAGLLATAALGEWPGAHQLLGGGLVLGGCLLAAGGR